MRGWFAIFLGILGLILGWLCATGKQATVAPPPPPAVSAPPPVAAPAMPATVTARLDADAKLVLEGAVADQAARDAIVAAANAAVGPPRVVDRLSIDGKLGALASFALRGDVPSDAIRTSMGEAVQKALGTVRVDNQLRVVAPVLQTKLRDILAARHIEFTTGSAILTPRGVAVLEELLPLVQAEANTRIEIQGHTDNVGDGASNLRLSEARAQTTRAYLVKRGVTAERLTAKGFGDANPVADNATLEGRQKNRRIDLVVQER